VTLQQEGWAFAAIPVAIAVGLLVWGRVPIRFGWITRKDTPALFWGLIVMLAGFAGVFVLIGLGVIQAAQLRKLG
jgi:MFS family permease